MTKPTDNAPALPPIRISECQDCFYVPGETHIIDIIDPRTDRTLHFGHDEAAVKEREPRAQRMSLDEASRQIDIAATAKYVTGITEIEAAAYMEALNVLPPVGWKTSRGVESFKMSERTWGNLTAIYAQLGDRYFTFTDRITLNAEEIAERIAAYVAEHPTPMRPSSNSAPPSVPDREPA